MKTKAAILSAGVPVRIRFAIVALGLAVLAAPGLSHAQGVIGGMERGARQGAHEGNRAAGPVGGVIGGAIGAGVGGAVGGVGAFGCELGDTGGVEVVNGEVLAVAQ